MRRITLCMMVLAFSFSCKNAKNKQKPQGEEPAPVEAPGTDMIFNYAADSIPAGFELDTLVFEDTIKQVLFVQYYFRAQHDSLGEYNRCMQLAFEQNVQKALVYYQPVNGPGMSSTVETGPRAIHVGQRLIGTQFIEDSFTEGGAHHNYNWYSLNYDRKTGKILWFSKTFRLETARDSAMFTKLVGSHLDRGPLELCGTCNDSIDFFVKGRQVSFGPYLSWADGLQLAHLPLDSLVPFMDKRGILYGIYRSGQENP